MTKYLFCKQFNYYINPLPIALETKLRNSYFSKPGPRTITGIEILAKITSTNEFKRIRMPKKYCLKLDS
jgi:hypothetical protein